MNRSEKQALADYVRWVADDMELRDWYFDVYFETSRAIADMSSSRAAAEEQSWGAVIQVTRHRKHAAIWLPDTFRYEPAYQGYNGKVTIAHELTHCHWAACWDMVRGDTYDADIFDGDQSYQFFVNGYGRLMEYGVDAIACVIARHLPEIPWPSPRRRARTR